MVFNNIFKKKDPVCGMKQEKGKGIKHNGNWFCSESCKVEYANKMKKKSGCCGNCEEMS